MTNATHYERRPTLVLPPPELSAFAAVPYGVALPSGASKHWAAVASWQFAGYATVEVVSGPAGIVTITKAGKRAAGQDDPIPPTGGKQ